jgi:hypothetical protein
MSAIRVGCLCGWRGRRVWRRCEMEHATSCSCHLGQCPKCGGRVVGMSDLRFATSIRAMLANAVSVSAEEELCATPQRSSGGVG